MLRAISTLKDHLHAPVVFDKNLGGYKYDRSQGQAFELPGLWFSGNALQALAIMRRLLEDAGGGLLGASGAARETPRRAHARPEAQPSARRRLAFGSPRSPRGRRARRSTRLLPRRFSAASSGWSTTRAAPTSTLERTVSPQRITHYREAWYLDAWDESREGLRSVSVDRIHHATVLPARAVDVPESDLDEHYASAYGIFGGKADKVAVLRFTPERARWVADEQWHPEQKGTWLADGSYELTIPYRESRELVMDIMRHGADVEVIAPQELRKKLSEQLLAAAEGYR